MSQTRWVNLAVVALLLLMVAEVALSTRQQSPSWDEGDHIYSGYMNWTRGEYSLNPEHPPLVKLIATLPLLPLHLKIAPRQNRFFKDEAYFGGRELIFRNAPQYGGLYTSDTLLFRVHMGALVFGLTLGLLLFLFAQEAFGPTAALIALALYVFDPTILANAPFVATDMGGSCGIFAAVYTFYRFAKQQTVPRAALCGLATGLALTTKHSAVLLVPILVLLAAGELAARWRNQRRFPSRDALHLAAGLALLWTLALFVLWGVYSFRYAMHSSGVVLPPLASKLPPLAPAMRSLILFCSHHHLLPESYLYGLVDVQQVGENTTTYIFGRIYEHGVWYYFPAILSLKFTVGFLGLLALAIFAFATGRLRRSREIFFLAFPVVFYLAIAMAGPLNIGVRHVLPIFAFTFALTGVGCAWLLQQRRLWIYPIAALLLWHVTDSLRVFPNYLPYANVLWGGPANTHRYFTDSAVDWAQQLKFTRQYIDAHHIHDCSFAYFAAPFLLPSDYGIPCQPLPTLDTMGQEDIAVPAIVHGPIFVSYGDLNGYEFGSKLRNPYIRLANRTPDAVIADGIAVFNTDIALPEAAALEHEHRSSLLLAKDPQAALLEAQQAVALVPDNFDANLCLGDAQAALHNRPMALAAYATCQQRIAEMEPSAQQYWSPILHSKLVALASPR
jgi:hypothetical protein